MKSKSSFFCLFSKQIIISFFFIALFSMLLCSPLQAQSGRKIPNKPKPPETTKPTEPEAPTTETKKDVPKIPVMIAYAVDNMNVSRIYSEVVAESCASRMNESDIRIQMGKEMNRKEASDTAKKSEELYVAMIQLGIDSFNSSRETMGTYIDPSYLIIEYTLFEPKTGKARTSGRIYPRRSLNDPLSLPQSRTAAEQRLRRAAEEAADRMIAAMNLPLPPPHR